MAIMASGMTSLPRCDVVVQRRPGGPADADEEKLSFPAHRPHTLELRPIRAVARLYTPSSSGLPRGSRARARSPVQRRACGRLDPRVKPEDDGGGWDAVERRSPRRRGHRLSYSDPANSLP